MNINEIAAALPGIEHEWQEGGKLGLTFGKNTWHWFKVDLDGYVWFLQSYSQITGKMRGRRAFSHQFKIERYLIKKAKNAGA